MPDSTTFGSYTNAKQENILRDFMDLFRGNERGYGVGEFAGAKQREDDNKWTPGHVRWTWGKPVEDQYRAHLAGELLVGIGVLCDDGCVWFTCLDVDDYDIDYGETMQRVRQTSLPLCVFRTKSGGLRITLFFSEPISAEDVISRMKRLSAMLGYAGCEVFPKQTKLDVEHNDCPSWIYLPYSGTRDIFAEAGLMNEMGNLMEIDVAMKYCMDRRLTRANFFNLFAAEDKAKSNGKTNGHKHPKGAWVSEDTDEKTMDAMFWGGPPCLWTLAHSYPGLGMQNNFLLNAGTLMKKKYGENWDKALEYVNYHILKPSGDRDRFYDIIKRLKHHDYEYQCHDEPMCNHCFSDACRRQPHGVGSGGNGLGQLELGITIIKRVPRIYLLNVGEERIAFAPEDLLTQHRYKIKCMEHGVPFPNSMKKEEWENLIRRALSNATEVAPKHFMRTNAQEIEILCEYFGRHIPIWIRSGYPNDKTDTVRVREDEHKIYFKWDALSAWMRRSFKDGDVKAMQTFLNSSGEEHGAGGRGHWWRCTVSVPFDMFDEDTIQRWLNPEE